MSRAPLRVERKGERKEGVMTPIRSQAHIHLADCRGISLTRNSAPPQDHNKALGIVLL